ncbi:hypothetical protein HK102_004866, partial [Quaeritorhiza haematococci]
NIINATNNNKNNDENNNGNDAPPETPPETKSGPTEQLISHIQRQLHKNRLDAHPRAFTDYLQQMRDLRDNRELLI